MQNQQNPKKKNWVKISLIIVGTLIGLFVLSALIASCFVDPTVSWSKIKSPTNQKEVSISGDTKSGVGKAKLYNNDKEIKEADINNKKFTFEKVELQEGDNNLKVSVTTKDGKTKTSENNKIVLDTTPPKIELSQSDQETDKDKFTISGKTEKDVEIKLTKNDKEVSSIKTNNESFEFKDVQLDSGDNKFKLTVKDGLGNSADKEINIKRTAKEEANKTQSETKTSFIDKVNEIGGKFETTIWEGDNLIIDQETTPPYQIVINAGANDISSCYYAKNIAYDILHKLYTDDATKNKISRVRFNAANYASVSLGYNDAFQDGKELDWSGQTNFWNTMMKYKSYEDETGDLQNRTWGVYIGSDCK